MKLQSVLTSSSQGIELNTVLLSLSGPLPTELPQSLPRLLMMNLRSILAKNPQGIECTCIARYQGNSRLRSHIMQRKMTNTVAVRWFSRELKLHVPITESSVCDSEWILGVTFLSLHSRSSPSSAFLTA